MTIKPKKCKDCKEIFQPFKTLQPRCVPCAIAKGKVNAQKQRDKALKADQKKARVKLAIRKEAIKPRSKVMGEADTAFQEYIRYRDRDLVCINTGVTVPWDGNESDAAHYISKSANTAMRYDLRNCHKSTKKSNKNQEKYIHDYRDNLIERIGIERFESMMAEAKYYKINKRGLDKEYLQRVKRVFRKKLRILKRIRKEV